MKIWLVIVTCIITITGSFFFTKAIEKKKHDKSLSIIKQLRSKSYKVERFIIENFPIFSDYASNAIRKKLRQHLLMDHINLAKEKKLTVVENQAHVRKLENDKRLIKIKQTADSNYYFYNVRKHLRYLDPTAYKGLINIARELQAFIREKSQLPKFKIKFAVSSALRTVEKQNRLRKKNANASFISSHSYGNSFDIFYDDFFIDIWPELNKSKEISSEIIKMKNRIGYMLGDSLRRQLKTILMKVLIRLQNEGKIYAIIERNQKCFHVSVR